MSSTNITTATEATFNNEINNATSLVLVDFYADWCGPCKQIAPILQELADEFKDNLKILKVNVDNDAGLAEKYGVRGIPTLVILEKSEIKKTLVGFQSKEKLTDAINAVKGA